MLEQLDCVLGLRDLSQFREPIYVRGQQQRLPVVTRPMAGLL